MQTAIIVISEAGQETARLIQKETQGEIIERTDVGAHWSDYDAFVFIGAMGICVRTIAPYVDDKHTDPAVVCVDSMGLHVISVLSGHVGGANELTNRLASLLGADAVITTQSDNANLWALDTMEQRFGWSVESEDEMNDCIFAFVNKQPTALLLDVRDKGTDYMERSLPSHVTLIKDIKEAKDYKLLIIVSPYVKRYPRKTLVLHFVPKIASVGFGLADHPANYQYIYDDFCDVLLDKGLLPCVKDYCTIDVKADEPFVDELRTYGETVRFFTADELAQVEVPTPSDVVEKHVGTPSVSEAAAILGSNHGQLIIKKVKGDNWTLAVAIPKENLR